MHVVCLHSPPPLPPAPALRPHSSPQRTPGSARKALTKCIEPNKSEKFLCKNNNKQKKVTKKKNRTPEEEEEEEVAENEHFKINAKLLSHDAVCGRRRRERLRLRQRQRMRRARCGLRNYIRYLYVKWPDGRRVALYL